MVVLIDLIDNIDVVVGLLCWYGLVVVWCRWIWVLLVLMLVGVVLIVVVLIFGVLGWVWILWVVLIVGCVGLVVDWV